MEPEKKSSGALIGSIIIIIILIIGGIYLWTSMERPLDEAVTQEETSQNAAALEAELNSMDLESLDEGI